MAFYGEADIPSMLSEFGVDVTIGGTTVKGILDTVDHEVMGEEMAPAIGESVTVHVKTGSLPGLAAGASITIDGTDYTVRGVLKVEDGALSRVVCVSE